MSFIYFDEISSLSIHIKRGSIANLSDLMDKKDALKKEQLVTAILKSEKTFEEVLAFLSKTTDEEK